MLWRMLRRIADPPRQRYNSSMRARFRNHRIFKQSRKCSHALDHLEAKKGWDDMSPPVTADSRRLAAVVADRNSPQKNVWRAQIIPLTADGVARFGAWPAPLLQPGGSYGCE